MPFVAEFLFFYCSEVALRNWLILFVPYFGPWPVWMDLFLLSCGTNSDITWLLITDNNPPNDSPRNVEFIKISFASYVKNMSDKLAICFNHTDPYKMCEARPALGYVYETEIINYEFFGYCDIDVVWGNISNFYLYIKENYDMITTSRRLVSGHFSIFRNTEQMRRAFLKVPGYPELLEKQGHTGFEEVHFASVFRDPSIWGLENAPRALFWEQGSTVLDPGCWQDGTMNYPTEWRWRAGRLTTNQYPNIEFLYLHFMRWKSLRYAPNPPAYTEGAWLKLEKLVEVGRLQAKRNGFTISANGFQPLRKKGKPSDQRHWIPHAYKLVRHVFSQLHR